MSKAISRTIGKVNRLNAVHVILVLIFLMFVTDSLNSILLYLDYPIWRISIFVRGLAQIVFLWLLLRKRSGMGFLAFILFFYLVLLIGSFAAIGHFQEYNLIENFSLINKMLFVFISWEVFRNIFANSEDRQKLFRLFEILILVEVVTIILGFIFKLDVFSSYGELRFGYKGLIPAVNETSGFFLISFFYFLLKVKRERNSWNIIPLLLTLVAGLLTGAKVTLVLPIILILFLLQGMPISMFKRRNIRIYASLVVVGMLIGFVAYRNWDFLMTRLEPSIAYFGYFLEKYSISSVFVSGRDLRIEIFSVEYLPRFTWANYLFGGQDLSHYSTETDLIDTFARLGLIGGLVFYFFYIKMLIGKVHLLGFLRILFVITWLGVSTIAGHLIFSAINAVYLAILLLSFSSDSFTEIIHLRLIRPTPLRSPLAGEGLNTANQPAGGR